MRRLRDDQGFALVTAIMLLFIMTGLGMGLLFLTDSQQKASSKEQAAESAFVVAEAALNAQTGQLARSWPSKEELEFPSACTASTTTSTNGCPSSESLKVAYPNSGSTSCNPITEPWGSSSSNEWTTYVRDDGPKGGEASTVFSSEVKNYPRWDANGDGKVWVRTSGIVQCRIVNMIELVSEQLVPIPFPEKALDGNWFETSNNGNKVIINTKGEAAESGGTSMRCEGRTESSCEEYREGQVSPESKQAATASPTFSESELTTVKNAAKAINKYYKSGECPKTMKEITGNPVYVEGSCNLSFEGNEVGNSIAELGFLVIEKGTFSINGGAIFYGTVYAANKQNSSGVVVEVHGSAKLVGTIVVDGKGGMSFGSSGGNAEEKENFIYNPNGVKKLQSFAGAAGTRNSFRVLPANQ